MNPAIATITIFALVCTKTVDLLRNLFDPKGRAKPYVWNVVSLAIGMTLAFIWSLNALEGVSQTPAQGIAGQVLTGLGISGAAGGWHELLDALASFGKKARRERS